MRAGRGLCGSDSPILPRAGPNSDERIDWRLAGHLVQCASAEPRACSESGVIAVGIVIFTSNVGESGLFMSSSGC